MSGLWDDLELKAPQDKSKISLTEHWEVNYWTRTLNCTKSELEAAIKAVGNGTEKVKAHLGKSK